jgi:hypothetical protein
MSCFVSLFQPRQGGVGARREIVVEDVSEVRLVH